MNEDTDMYFGIAIVLIIISCCILYSCRHILRRKPKTMIISKSYSLQWYKNVLEYEERRKLEGEDI